MAGDIEQAKWRRRNALRAVSDALVELRVADRLLREAKGLPTGDAGTSPGVASDPAEVMVPAPAGSADSATVAQGWVFSFGGELVWPPEFQR